MPLASWVKGTPLEKFTSGYAGHRTDRRAIREWTAARLRGRSAKALLKWIGDEDREALRCLDQLAALSPNSRVRKAIANAQEHRAWLKLIRAEVHASGHPPRGPGPRRRRGPRVGLLAREAQSHTR